MESFYIGVYWGVRKESVASCAERTAKLLTCLATCDPIFEHWFEQGRSKKEALKSEIKVEPEALQKLLLGGKNRTDVGNEVIKELGFRVGMWTGGSDDGSASLTIKCGSYAPIPGINSCILSLPIEEPIAERLLHVPVLTSLLECMVAVWSPEWGLVTSRQYQSLPGNLGADVPQTGWIVYLAGHRASIADRALTPPSEVQRLGTDGSLLIATNEPFSASNQEHVAAADRLALLLK
ncbi:MAG TPA: Imm52 family immunity protein [Herpetosiphonaceae bacterium]